MSASPTTHMMVMLNIDLGLDEELGVRSPAGDEEPVEVQARYQPPPLEPNSVTAKALLSVWGGERTTIIDSPPGAGKTTTCATIVSHLVQRTDLKVIVAGFTRDQVISLAHRLADVIPPDQIIFGVRNVSEDQIPRGVHFMSAATDDGDNPVNRVEVRTLASARMRQAKADILVVDEAYQVTFADVRQAATQVEQVLLIGDPGQIGPVITADTTAWERHRIQPHGRAPEIFAHIGEPVIHNLDTTWRLGPVTAKAIAPLYRFAFTSKRPQREIVGLSEIESFELEPAAALFDPTALSVVASHAAAIAQDGVLRTPDGDRPLEQSDVAVVVAHNMQVSIISGLLNSMGCDEVTVGTADRLQGGEWHAVVAVDPLIGFDGANGSEHSMSLGRLCVMASRHATHLSWFHDGRWDTVIEVAVSNDEEAAIARSVREALTAR